MNDSREWFQRLTAAEAMVAELEQQLAEAKKLTRAKAMDVVEAELRLHGYEIVRTDRFQKWVNHCVWDGQSSLIEALDGVSR